MTLDNSGVRVACGSCGTINRIKYRGLNRSTRCAKCHTNLPAPAAPIDVQGTEDFDAAVSDSSVPVVVDFWASWCGPCRMVAPEIKKVAEHLAGRVLVLKVDTEAHPELSARFNIQSIPTIGVFQNGRELTRVAGVRPAAAIEALVPAA